MKYLIGFLFLLPTFAQTEVVEKIVAIVNDEIITLSDVKKYKEKLSKGVLFDELLVQGQDVKEVLANQNKLINLIIDEKIIDSEIKKQGLSVTIERVEKEIRNISKGNNMSRAQLKEVLQRQGVDFAEYQNVIKTKLERQSLIEKNVTSKIQVSDEEVASYRSEGGGGSGQISEYTISHILFKIPKGNEAKARKRAQEVLKKLKAGESFEKLAEDFSEDPNFSKGGTLGTFRDGELLKEFEKPVRSLSSGAYSDIIKTRMGLHILKVNDKKVVSNKIGDREKEKVRSLLTQRAFQKQFRIWIDQRRQDAFIRINQT